MTGIMRTGVSGGGPFAAPAEAAKAEEPAEDTGFVASGQVGEDGISVDRRPGIRTTLLMTGFGVLGGGAMAVAASRLPKFALQNSFGSGAKFLQWGGIAAAGVGAVLTAIGLTQGADRIGYVAKVDGTRSDALTKAAESQKDVGVVQIDGDSWGVVDLTGEDTAIDERGPAGISIGKPPVPFDSFVSEFGDAYVREGGGFSNIGAPDRIAAASIAKGDLSKLTGAQVGVTPAGQRLVLGEPVDGKVHAQRADAVRDSFESGAKNLAIVKVKDGFAAFKVTGGDVSLDSAARGFRIEPFAAVELLTADGLVGATKPAGAFERVAMPVDDVTKIKVDDAKSLEGRRIGDGQLKLGQHVGNYESVAKGGAELFEKKTGPVVFLQLDGGVAAYKVARAFESFDTMLGGSAEAVTLLDATTLRRPGTTGESTRAGRLPRVDVTNMSLADAPGLVGRRIGTGNVELGNVVKTYPSIEAAGADQFETGAPHRVVLRFKDGAAVYEAKQFNGFETLLGGQGGVYSLAGSSWNTTTENDRELAGAGRVKVINASTLAVGDAGQLVGKRFAMDGGRIVRINGVASTHGSLAEAMRSAAGQGGDRYVVQLKGGAAIVSLDGSGRDVETGIHPADQLTQVNGRLAFGTGGDSWSFRSRSIPFQSNEPLGHELVVRGERGVARTHLGSYSSQGAAYGSFDSSLRGGRYAVVNADGPEGSWHVYDLGEGGGSSWDERLGDAAAISELQTSFNDYYRQTETPGRETVYYVQEHRKWRERTTDSGTTTTADTGIERSETVDQGRTNDLRRRREAEREEARRQAEEAERRRQEAEERRRQEERDRANSGGGSGGGGSGGNSNPGGGGGGSGSGGNSNPGGGGGYDPGGGGAGSDW
jgi:hypothetical protein